MVHVLVEDDLLGSSHTLEFVRLAFVATVNTHAKEDLLGISLLLKGIIETKNRVCRCSSQATPSGKGCSTLGDNLAVATSDEASKHSVLEK